MTENIFFSLFEKENEKVIENNIYFNELYQKVFENNVGENSDIYSDLVNNNIEFYEYELKYNIKQLLLIAEYYGIKQKLKKYNKIFMIYSIVEFEKQEKNSEMVNKRKKLWMYIEELKKDKIMKKYIILP
jgi:hypothetical protein